MTIDSEEYGKVAVVTVGYCEYTPTPADPRHANLSALPVANAGSADGLTNSIRPNPGQPAGQGVKGPLLSMNLKNTTSKSFQPLSPAEIPHLRRVCAELGIDPAYYHSDEALCQAITDAILAEVEAQDRPSAGFYQI